MGIGLKEWLYEGGESLRWVEPNGYATNAFAGGDPHWLARPQVAASIIAEATGALGSNVVTVNPLPAFLDALNLEPGDRDPIEAAESALEETEALARAHGVVKAVEYALGGRLDLVLQLPAPVRLLKMFGLTDSSSTLSPGMLEDAGALLADFARQFASYDFNGLMVWLDVSCDDVPGQHEAMDSVISTIRHYRWIYLVRMSNCTELTPLEGVSADVILLPDLPPSKYRRYTGDGYPCVGGGLSRAFWAGETFESYSPGSLYYGDAPADEEPEKVLARLRALP